MMNFFWSISILISITVSVVLVFFLFQTQAVRGKLSLLAFSAALIVASLAFLLKLFFDLSPYIRNFHNLLIGLIYASILSALTALLVFFLEYTRRVNWLTPINTLMLGLQPTLTLCILWFGPPEWSYTTVNNIVYANGQWMWMVSIYGQFLAFFSILIFIRIYQGVYPVREWSRSVVIGYFCIMVVQQASLLAIPVQTYLALYLGALSFLGMIIIYVFLHRGLLNIVPISREAVVEKMPDGWTIIDNNNRILDLNSVAESVVGHREALIGQDVGLIFGNWDKVSESSNAEEDVQLNAVTSTVNRKKFYSLNAIQLTDNQSNARIGWVVLWRDITQRHAREQSRQRAQNEMFGLLYSISSAASRTQTLENFINVTMQDIIHVFKCRQGVVFLADKDSAAASNELFLAAHYGLPAMAQNKMYVISVKSPLVIEAIKTREPVVILEADTDARVPEMMQNAVSNSSLLIVPMMSDDQLIGIMCLSRDSIHSFANEEIGNLSTIAEQVANYVSGDRRRQLAIILAERQKLVRDLHDSVTQKLYGLVALTEAAKAGLEVGSTETMIQVLPRIGENARQALKEMRLFLYGLQPVNIERDGLTSVLHQRLAAVEGRADIKARFISDDNISLPIEKQIALYFIAQEALNNVLKHAKASSVTIHLSETRSNIVLEIVDDGCGASPTQLKGGGMGIKNMNYRASQVGGKLKIDSFPGKGTKVKVTLVKESEEKARNEAQV
jgi:PAS domain S-box-containing protein